MTTDAQPARKRGRPRATSEEIEARRRKLIAGAYSVFLERGYHETTIADITTRAGLGFGTFYKDFSSKREILDAVIDYGVEEILSGILREDVAATATTIEELEVQFRTMASRIYAAFADRPKLAKFLVLEATTIDAAMADRWFGLVDLATSLVAGYLESGAAQGILRAGFDTSETARAIVGIILMGVLNTANGRPVAEDRDPYLESSIALIINGIS